MSKKAIAVAKGDGIGPEIMDVTLRLLQAAGADLEFHEVEIGENVYLRGHVSGIEDSTWETILNTRAFLKAPITTPQGGGFKSLNVTVRTTLGLYANLRPCVSYAPFVATKHPKMNVVVVRENEEDLYAGIEYRQTAQVCESLKLISEAGSKKICKYAFDYARKNGRKKVTCFTKDNIMKFSDGLFHRVFEETAADYPDIENEHWIVDIGSAKLADTPEAFDVVVMPNLYGDILSDVGAQIAGSVGLAGSANIGEYGAMFEAIHGSAPRRAGQNLANPSGLIHGAILMLQHIGESQAATTLHNAWLCTVEEGIHTYDIFKEGVSKEKVGTKEFGQAIEKNMGKKPSTLKPVDYPSSEGAEALEAVKIPDSKEVRKLVGTDIFVFFKGKTQELLSKLQAVDNNALDLVMITNRGVRVWPDGRDQTFCIEQYRCRFMSSGEDDEVSQDQILSQLSVLSDAGMDIIKTENLYTFDGVPGFSSSEIKRPQAAVS